ncbi:MAG TPA: abortive phage resistance protein [Lentisphaeria bacterium]|nr:MAG: hypothetical protein A2X47_03990 [Lentisphaerae bacterium GWF2_38_69]HBM16149.1 abortive phage resistance protein [Lentisphaeria bacterium]
MNIYDGINTDYDKAVALVRILESCATGGERHENKFIEIRGYFYQSPKYKNYMPRWMNSIFTINNFWNFIKPKFNHYFERRDFISSEFTPLINHCNEQSSLIQNQNVIITDFNSYVINENWTNMLARVENDPKGAITLARSLVESVCKHILDDLLENYTKDELLASLYKKAAKILNLTPEQHDIQIIKNILGGCSSIVKGLEEFRNIYGDAHGKGQNQSNPLSRHARLAVNASGTLCLFLIETFNHNKASRE